MRPHTIFRIGCRAALALIGLLSAPPANRASLATFPSRQLSRKRDSFISLVDHGCNGNQRHQAASVPNSAGAAFL